MNILGAGLSGLICGALNAQSAIYERNSSDVVSHQAVLRFRDDRIARALGLTFRRVTVHKAIWYDGKEIAPSPRVANEYSLKVRGVITLNSSWNVAPAERYIAPEDLHAVLADICGKRVHWQNDIDTIQLMQMLESGSVVSTIPLPLLLRLLSLPAPFPFHSQPISVNRYYIDECDVFQTVYFPDPSLNVYRATLTGRLLTIEAATTITDEETTEVLAAFGLLRQNALASLEPVSANHRQQFGKIAPVPENERKGLLHKLTQEQGIFSLGRFATWRNILLDDVYDDIAAIRRMMTLSHYDRKLELMK